MDSQPKRKLTAREIAAQFRAEIAAGKYGPGAQLPAARGQATKYGVALATVQSAYAQLRAEGLVRGRAGSGTYVLDPALGEPSPRDAAQGLIDLRDEVARVSADLSGLVERVRRLEETVGSLAGESDG
ncbi:GntR family transcriptional regulator [Streptomyces sp. WMMC905]|uniref:GntR family transcriptional regulator n=1 Tax=Streptomyces sp. WMMC905 TaxID=3404123 RepID=UPI003B95165F